MKTNDSHTSKSRIKWTEKFGPVSVYIIGIIIVCLQLRSLL